MFAKIGSILKKCNFLLNVQKRLVKEYIIKNDCSKQTRYPNDWLFKIIKKFYQLKIQPIIFIVMLSDFDQFKKALKYFLF